VFVLACNKRWWNSKLTALFIQVCKTCVTKAAVRWLEDLFCSYDVPGVKRGSMWPQGYIPCVPFKPEKYHLFMPSPMHACPRHDPWERLWSAKSCKGETRVPDATIGTNQLREITPTENPRSSLEAGVEHKASNLVL
jgi:hypothetical protein